MSSSINLEDEINNVIKQRSSISHLYNCVCEGVIHASKGFVPSTTTSRLCYDSDNSSWIRLIRLNKVSFSKWMNYRRNTYRRRGDDITYLSIFNKNLSNNCNDNVTNKLYSGVNIDTDIKINGYHYNICDIFSSYFVESANTSYSSNYKNDNISATFKNSIYKLIYITEKNYLIGFIDVDAILYLDNVLLKKIRESSFDDFVKVINRLLSVYANANSLFFNLNTQSVDKTVAEKIAARIVSHISYDAESCTIIPPDHIDLFEDHSLVTSLIGKLSEKIKNYAESIIKGTRWGISDQYSYKKLLDSVMTSKYMIDKKAKEKAFLQGLVYGNKFELAGWIISDKRFNDDDAVCWEKTVDIVPCRFFYHNKMYIINESNDEWQNPFKIEKLYVTGSGVMYCEGKHPNVSGGKVCMGDISGKINMNDIKKLQANLARCESLLTSINYDSPYDSSRREELLNHSVLADGQTSDSDASDSEYIAQGTIMQDIVFEEDETYLDVDDDSTIVVGDSDNSNEVRPIQQIDDGSNIVGDSGTSNEVRSMHQSEYYNSNNGVTSHD